MLFACAVALFQIASFLAGGLIAPAPSSYQNLLASKCVDRISPLRGQYSDRWFFQRPQESPYSCNETVEKISDIRTKTEASQVVFMFQFPLPKSGYDLDMTRWFQQITGLLTLDIDFKRELPVRCNALFDSVSFQPLPASLFSFFRLERMQRFSLTSAWGIATEATLRTTGKSLLVRARRDL